MNNNIKINFNITKLYPSVVYHLIMNFSIKTFDEFLITNFDIFFLLCGN